MQLGSVVIGGQSYEVRVVNRLVVEGEAVEVLIDHDDRTVATTLACRESLLLAMVNEMGYSSPVLSVPLVGAVD